MDRLAGKKPGGASDEEEPSEERTPAAPRRAPGPADHPVPTVHADERALESLTVAERVSDTYRRLGYAVVSAVPQSGILRGRAAVVSLADGPLSGRVLVADGAQTISLNPCAFGIADRVGSIAPGKDATLFVTDRDVLDIRYTVVSAYVDGCPLDLSDRHKRLYERYRNRPKREIK